MLAQPSMIKRPVLTFNKELLIGFKPDDYAAALATQIERFTGSDFA